MALQRGRGNANALLDSLQRCEAGLLPPVDETPARLEADKRKCQPGQSAYDDLDRASKNGGVAFDADKLQACLRKARDLRRARSAWALYPAVKASRLDLECAAVLVPLRREGDLCSTDLECPRGTSCEAADPTVQKFACLRPAAIGERCETRTCDPATAVCLDGRCKAGRSAGEPCDDHNGCRGGAGCNPTTHRCERESVGALGDACGKCQDGLSCLANRCVNEQSVAAGMPCSEDNQCAGTCFSCNAAKSGGLGKICAPRGPAHDACGQNSDCMYGLRCALDHVDPGSTSAHDAAGECVPRLVDGARCTDTSECADALFCDPADGCTKHRLDGQSCSGKEACANGLLCLSGLCRPTPAGEGDERGEGSHITWQRRADVGEACAETACRSTLICSAGTCHERAPAGARCTADNQCVSNTCLADEHVCKAAKPNGGCTSRNDFSTYLPLAAFVIVPRLRFQRRARGRAR